MSCLRFLLLVAVLAATLPAQHPVVQRVLPHGARRGQEVTVQIYGQRIGGITGIFLFQPGLEVTDIKAARPNRAQVKINIPKDCPPGVHKFAVRTPYGTSNMRTFHVGTLTEQSEKEPNNSQDQAQAVKLDVVVNGTVRAADTDVFAVPMKKGQHVHIEAVGLRLGEVHLDLYMELRDAKGRLLARNDDDILTHLDPLIRFACPADATYYVHLHENGHGGGNNNDYRLHVGTFPRPQLAWPPGGRPGETVTVRWLTPGVTWSKARVSKVTLPQDKGLYQHFCVGAAGPAPLAASLWVGDLPTTAYGNTPGKGAKPLSPLKLGGWHFLGPLANPRDKKGSHLGHAKVYAPEVKLDLAAELDGRDGRIKWKPTKLKDGNLHDLRRIVKPSDRAVVYLFREIQCPTAREVLLLFGSDDTLKVWLDAKLIHDVAKPRATRKDQDRLIVKLHPGKNQLLCKVTNGGGGFGFYHRLLDPQRGSGHALTPPIAVHGLLARPGQFDSWRFLAKRGDRIEFRVVARQLRSPADPVISITGTVERFYVANDDRMGKDSLLNFRAPHTGEFTLYLGDMLRRGSPLNVYRLEARRGLQRQATSRLALGGRPPRWVIDVPAGGQVASLIEVRDMPRRPKLELRGLPPGVAAEVAPFVAGLNTVPVILRAAKDAKVGIGTLVEVGAPGTNLAHEQYQALVTARNQQPYLQARTDRLPVAVTKAAPFRIQFPSPKTALIQNSPMQLKIKVQRDKGFKQRVYLRMLGNPPGVTSNQVRVEPNKSEGVITLNARNNARAGNYPIVVLATATVAGGPYSTSSKMHRLLVESTWYQIRLPRLRGAQGEKLQLEVPINTTATGKKSAGGKLAAQLVGLPRGIAAGPAKLSADGKQVSFELSLSPRTPPGRHRAWRLRLTVPDKKGVRTTMDFTGGEIRVDRRAKGD